MDNKRLVFDYHAGMVRRDFASEGPKHIYKADKKTNKGLFASIRKLLGLA